MKYPSLEYDIAVEQNQQKIRGNLSSTKMTKEETLKAISDIVPNYKSEVVDNTVNEVQPILPKRRGRPPGSRNRPKETK